MNSYEILGVKGTDSITTITKKYKELAFKYHPDRNYNKPLYTEKFKEINKAYNHIKQNHTAPGIGTDKETFNFKNFTEKLINKGEIINNILNKAKNIDVTEFFKLFFDNIKKIRFYYDNIFCEEQTEDIVVNVNTELEDIFKNEEKIVNLERTRKCKKCFNDNIKFCENCNNKLYYKEQKCFVFSSNSKVVVFPGESNEEKNKKAGDIIIKIIPKLNNDFSIINNIDLLYFIKTDKQQTIVHEFMFLDGKTYIFECNFPYRERYIIKNRGLISPYSEKIGDLIIKIDYRINSENNNSFKFILK